ncbi:RNA polymerase sigma factor [Mariniblastus fucicola]|uniref:RNA polymerase sigma factor n=2 Tax=Mariniblastus fucicola TaxID=980251 RepID=A0A5B9PHM4_9BACT|nr:RNA polymerase sigma factor [Mariniblastus fucicola]
MRTLVLAMVPGCRDVDDILQESCAAMWKKIDSYDSQRPFANWSLAFVRMQTMAWLKRQGRDRLRMSGEAMDSIYQSVEESYEPSRDHRKVNALEDCLMLLNESEKSLLTSRYVHGESVGELAEKTSGRTSAALYKQFARLQSRLLRCIEGKLGEL